MNPFQTRGGNILVMDSSKQLQISAQFKKRKEAIQVGVSPTAPKFCLFVTETNSNASSFVLWFNFNFIHSSPKQWDKISHYPHPPPLPPPGSESSPILHCSTPQKIIPSNSGQTRRHSQPHRLPNVKSRSSYDVSYLHSLQFIATDFPPKCPSRDKTLSSWLWSITRNKLHSDLIQITYHPPAISQTCLLLHAGLIYHHV